jgi:hypothetical protein
VGLRCIPASPLTPLRLRRGEHRHAPVSSTSSPSRQNRGSFKRGVNNSELSKHIQVKKFAPILFALIAVCCSIASAQEMEPRSYSRAPVGTQFVLITYAHQSGDVFTDSSLPLRDVKVKLHSGSLAYGRTFGFAGRQLSASFFVPYIKGNVSGTVFEDQLKVTRSGLGDIRARVMINLIGSPALKPKEFAAYKARTVVGASMTVIAPTGQYDPRRLVNISSNRWAFKPEVGLSKPVGRWTLETAGGVWLFTANNNFFGGSRREQKPLISLQGSVIYTLRPRTWVAVNASYYTGGRTTVNGVVNADRQGNSRIGITGSIPLNQKQSVKVAYAKGVTTRFGGHLSTFAVGWGYTWF